MIADRVLSAREVEPFTIELAKNHRHGHLYVRVRLGAQLFYDEPVESEREGMQLMRGIRTGMSCYQQAMWSETMKGWRKKEGAG